MDRRGKNQSGEKNPMWGKHLSLEARQRISEANKGKRNGQWKGDNAGHTAVRQWARARFKKPDFCENCGEQLPYDIVSKSGKYRRSLDDWWWLCRSCNMKLDGRMSNLKRFVVGDTRVYDSLGYVKIWISRDDFFYPMTQRKSIKNGGYILEHRLVVAKALGRNLHRWEIVHHKGVRYKGIANRSDNLEDNLQLVTDDRHKQITILERRVNYLETLLKQSGISF